MHSFTNTMTVMFLIVIRKLLLTFIQLFDNFLSSLKLLYKERPLENNNICSSFFFQMAIMFVFIYKLSGEVGQKFNFSSALLFLFLKTPLLLVFWESAGCLCHAFQISTLPSQLSWVLSEFHPGNSQVTILVVETSIFQDLGTNASSAFHAMHQWICCLLRLKTTHCWIRALFHQQLGKAIQGTDTPGGTLQGT